MVNLKVNTLKEGRDISVQVEGDLETIIDELATANAKVLIGLSVKTEIPVVELSELLDKATLENTLDALLSALINN